MKISVLTVLFVSLVLMAATAYAEEVKFCFSVTSDSYMKDIAKAYREQRQGLRLMSRRRRYSGIKSAGAGTVDIGGTCSI